MFHFTVKLILLFFFKTVTLCFGLIVRISVGHFRKVSKDEDFGFCAKNGDFFLNSPHTEIRASKLILLF